MAHRLVVVQVSSIPSQLSLATMPAFGRAPFAIVDKWFGVIVDRKDVMASATQEAELRDHPWGSRYVVRYLP